MSVFANYKNANTVWDNSLDLGYGFLQQGNNKSFVKTDDRIDFVSKYGKKAFSNFYYTALLNFKTQFAPGYNYPNDSVKISNFLAPAYMLGAIGLNYMPNAYFNAFVAPFTGKMTIVNDNALSAAGAYGVEPGKKLLGEFGGYARIIYSSSDFKGEFLKNVAFFKTRFILKLSQKSTKYSSKLGKSNCYESQQIYLCKSEYKFNV